MSKNLKKEKGKRRVTATQEVLYNQEFQKADRAAGYKRSTL